jgi:uncharacterized protein (TIGR02453 family)
MEIESFVFDFLTELEKNNNRDWFQQNKKRYDAALKNVQEFATQLIAGISVFDASVSSQQAKDCIFRIYRDVRFSHDKTPYKTHFGAYVAPKGRTSGNAGYYIHIQNDASFLAGGLWSPETSVLKRIREEIYYNPEELVGIIENKSFQSTFGELMEEDSLKKPPKNYPLDFPYIKLLKYRHFCTEKAVSNTEITAGDFLKKCLQILEISAPLVKYMNKVVGFED